MSGKLLNEASSNLFNRPPDEHFGSMQEIMDHATNAMNRSREVVVDQDKLYFCNTHNDIGLVVDQDDTGMVFPNNYMLTQFATEAGIPMKSLNRLSEDGDLDLTVKVLNKLMARQGDERKLFIESQNDAGDIGRSVNGTGYTRLYDAVALGEVNRWLLPVGYIPALPTMNTDEQQNNIMGNNKPALFRGDRDTFCFFYHSDDSPSDDLGGMRQGIMVWNSEVGAKSFGWSTFYFRDMCANFLIWGASNQQTRKFVHRGNIWDAKRWGEFQLDIQRLYEESEKRRGKDLEVFAKAAQTAFAGDGSATDANKSLAKEYLNNKFRLSGKRAEAIVKAALNPVNGGDLSVWSIVNGVTWDSKETTRVSQMVGDSAVVSKILATVR
jgi:hypothetical protein